MAADRGSRATSIVLGAVVLVTGYVAWQVAPLSGRMDQLDRDRLETRDRLQREIETLREELARARLLATAPGAAPAPSSGASASPAAGTRESAPAARAPSVVPGEPVAPPARPTVGRVNADTFFASRLLPEDATIASLLVDDIPVAEIARRLRHSKVFVVAKGIQIEKQLAAARDTPTDVLAALRAAVERAKAASQRPAGTE